MSLNLFQPENGAKYPVPPSVPPKGSQRELTGYLPRRTSRPSPHKLVVHKTPNQGRHLTSPTWKE